MDAPTNEFLDSLTFMFFPYILQPTRVSSSSKTLIDNIFSNILSADSVSRSHNSSLSFSTSPSTSSNIYDSDWTNFDQEKFILAYLAEDWDSAIKKEHPKVNLSFQNFLSKFNGMLNKYVPVDKISRNQTFKGKAWIITPSILKSISVKQQKTLWNSSTLKDAASKKFYQFY